MHFHYPRFPLQRLLTRRQVEIFELHGVSLASLFQCLRIILVFFSGNCCFIGLCPRELGSRRRRQYKTLTLVEVPRGVAGSNRYRGYRFPSRDVDKEKALHGSGGES